MYRTLRYFSCKSCLRCQYYFLCHMFRFTVIWTDKKKLATDKKNMCLDSHV